jgi:hypothetical protein
VPETRSFCFAARRKYKQYVAVRLVAFLLCIGEVICLSHCKDTGCLINIFCGVPKFLQAYTGIVKAVPNLPKSLQAHSEIVKAMPHFSKSLQVPAQLKQC